MTTSLDEVFERSDVIIVSKKGPSFGEAVKERAGSRVVIDLVRLWPELNGSPQNYEGISW
jgi:hypothetical protein